MKRNIITWIIILVVIVGGWALFVKDSTLPITEVASSETSSINVVATLSPEQPVAGEPTTLDLSFTNLDGSIASDLMTHHARRVHVVFVGQDFSSIGHIHPEDFTEVTDAVIESGKYSVDYTFPKAGKYIVGVDVMNSTGAIGKQFIINVKGTPKMERVVEKDLRTEKCFSGYPEDGTDRYVQPVMTSEAETECPNGYRVTFSTSVDTVTAGEEVRLSYHIEKDGKPVMDLEPFLDAPLHLAIVPATLSTLLHRHGEVAVVDTHMESMEGGMSDVGHMMEIGEIDTTGIHIMADGSVMLGNGEMLEEAHVTEAGMISLPDGTMVKPTMDLRSGGDTMESDNHMDMGHMHHAPVPSAFGPDLVSEGITFSEAGLYQVLAQAQHNGNIIYSNFMVNVEKPFSENNASVFDLTLVEQNLSTEVVTVNEGDNVIFRVSTDEEGEFHIAGYEIERGVEPSNVTEVRFTAHQAGRYNLELHPEGTEDDVVIGALVVNPK